MFALVGYLIIVYFLISIWFIEFANPQVLHLLQTVQIHGLVCDGQGNKMSKSKGNVVDPLQLITGEQLPQEQLAASAVRAHAADSNTQKQATEPVGADALRLCLLSHDLKSRMK